MKKNLNIAYLNGAEGMIRKGGASSGGNSDGSGEQNIYYYTINGRNALVYFSNKVKTRVGLYSDIWITSTAKWLYEWYETGSKNNTVFAIEVQYPIEDYLTGEDSLILNSLEEAVDYFELNISDFTPITKEQFYSLE